jgi:hypothetical protein
MRGRPVNDYMRVSDADRERVAERLREHFAAGRLTSEELDERVTAALGAKTAGELQTVLSDLPEPAPAGPQPGQVPPPWAGRPGFRYRRGPRLLPLALFLLFALLLFHGGGFVFFALFKIALVLFLVATLAGIFTVARFRRRARRYWQSGPGSQWHHHEWHR